MRLCQLLQDPRLEDEVYERGFYDVSGSSWKHPRGPVLTQYTAEEVGRGELQAVRHLHVVALGFQSEDSSNSALRSGAGGWR